MPSPIDEHLARFVREPWPSIALKMQLNFGMLEQQAVLRVVSEMGDGGIIFADGIENDSIEFASGQSVEISVAAQRLNLVVKKPIRAMNEFTGRLSDQSSSKTPPTSAPFVRAHLRSTNVRHLDSGVLRHWDKAGRTRLDNPHQIQNRACPS